MILTEGVMHFEISKPAEHKVLQISWPGGSLSIVVLRSCHSLLPKVHNSRTVTAGLMRVVIKRTG